MYPSLLPFLLFIRMCCLLCLQIVNPPPCLLFPTLFKPLSSPAWASASLSWFSACTSYHHHFYHSTIHHLCLRKRDLFIFRSMLSPSTAYHCILPLWAGWLHDLDLPTPLVSFPSASLWPCHLSLVHVSLALEHIQFIPISVPFLAISLLPARFWLDIYMFVPSNYSDFSSLITFSWG